MLDENADYFEISIVKDQNQNFPCVQGYKTILRTILTVFFLFNQQFGL